MTGGGEIDQTLCSMGTYNLQSISPCYFSWSGNARLVRIPRRVKYTLLTTLIKALSIRSVLVLCLPCALIKGFAEVYGLFKLKYTLDLYSFTVDFSVFLHEFFCQSHTNFRKFLSLQGDTPTFRFEVLYHFW